MPKRGELPTVTYLTDIIYGEWVTGDADDDSMDVRLVAGYADSSNEGVWTVNVGSADYDQWHGHCGASSIDLSTKATKKEARSIARDLLDQVRDSFAQSS